MGEVDCCKVSVWMECKRIELMHIGTYGSEIQYIFKFCETACFFYFQLTEYEQAVDKGWKPVEYTTYAPIAYE